MLFFEDQKVLTILQYLSLSYVWFLCLSNVLLKNTYSEVYLCKLSGHGLKYLLAIILQAVIFAAVHGYNSLGIIAVFISGIVFGFFTWKTNGIEVSSAIHTANNLSICLFVMFGLHSTSSTVELNDTIISVAFEIILLIIMYYVGKKTDWFGEIK